MPYKFVVEYCYMKEFLQSNKMTYNLMSFTGFKSILLFSFLLEGPKTYQEIKEHFAAQEYLKESISIDTLRVYINSLERMGCVIVRGKRSEGSKYMMLKHPFELKLKKEQVRSIIRVFKTISKDIDVEDLLYITKFFAKISQSIDDTSLRQKLENLSPLRKIDSEILKTLILSCRKKDEITIIYNSPNSNVKEIDVLAQNLYISNNKIYLSGISPDYKNSAKFLVARIVTKPVIKLQKTISEDTNPIIITCEIKDKNIELNANERIVSKDNDKIIVEIEASNNFLAKQRVLALGSTCKVLAPQSFKDEIIFTLKKMKEEYIAESV